MNTFDFYIYTRQLFTTSHKLGSWFGGFLKFTLVLALVSASTLNVAMADELSDYGKFQMRIEAARKTGLQGEVVFDAHREVAKLDSHTLEVLKSIAYDQAQIWGDTILEGDYEADGKTVLDRVESVSDTQGWIGFRITYSEKAWFLGTDEGERQPGRILESSFVSADQRVWLQDNQSYAQFH